MNESFPLIDTHCHLEQDFHRGTLSQQLAEADAANVCALIAVGTSPADWPIYHQLSTEHRGKIFYSVGLHPNAVDEHWQQAVDLLTKAVQWSPSPVAIGEIGLDYFRLPTNVQEAEQQKTRQQAAFTEQLEIARATQLPVIIHCRNAFEDCMQLLQDSGLPGERVVFHCFSDGPEQLERLRAYGGRASFTAIITYPNAPLVREALKLQGLDSLMLETDAPYLAPQTFRGKPNQPAYLPHTALKAAQITGSTLEEVARQTTHNAVRFFNLPHALLVEPTNHPSRIADRQ